MESSSSSSFSGSSKRAKAPGHIIQVAHCLVDGCNADLSLCKDYHRRHKVCEVHSKEAKVTIAGREQRFCQQCSRFHSPVEFDEGKRSCRKRLDDHNRRRRKPQPDTMSRNSGLVLSSQQGGRLVSFSSPQILPSAIVSSSWVGAVKSENNMVLYNNQQNSLAECSSHSYKGLNQFQFIQNSNHAASASQPLLDPSNSNQKTGFNNQVVDSDRALSLLSSTPTVTTEFGLNHVLRPEFVSQARASLVHNMHYSGLVEYPYAQESKPVVSARDSDSSTLHFQEMLQHDHEGSPTSGSHQTLTFMWE